MNITKHLDDFVEERCGDVSMTDVAVHFFNLGKTATVNAGCEWLHYYDPADYLEEVSDFGEYLLDEKAVLDNFKKYVEENV